MLQIQDMHTLQVESQTDEAPLACGGGQAAQRELAKAEDFFNDADHGLDRAFAQSVNRLSDLRPELEGHFDRCTGILSRWRWLLLEEGMPIFVMRFASSGNVRVNIPLFNCLNIGFTKVAVVQGGGLRFPDLGRDGFQGWNGFLLVIGMIRKGVGYDQQTPLIGGLCWLLTHPPGFER